MPPKRSSISDKTQTAGQQQPTPRSLRSNNKDQEKQPAPKPRSISQQPQKGPQPKKRLKGSKKQEPTQPKSATSQAKDQGKQAIKGQQKKEQKQLKSDKPQKQQETKSENKQSKTDKQQEKKQEQLKKVILKGTVPVDQHFSKAASFKVYTDNDMIYAATLNQSNINNNNNKFYILQILVHENNPKDVVFFTRWGRVGVSGQKSEERKPIQAAIKEYNKKLREKSKTYTVVEMNYEENSKEVPKDEKKEKQPDSKLDPKVQDLIRLIFDMKMMAKQMKEIGYDAKKMPLGKLAKKSISKGYEILKSLMEEIKKTDCRVKQENIRQLSGQFYSQIPHDFGFKNMINFVLDSEKKIKEKLQMLQSLEDIQVFTKLLDEGSADSDINQLDSNYAKLNIKINPLPKNTDTYQLLLKYVANTHASTHTAFKLFVQEIFEIEKEAEIKRYTTEIPNKMLLWHGSRLTNFVGILSQGLRIAPPEAPVTGYMFGKGVYFADMVTKSANYCFTSRQNNTGLMLLCQVALGEYNQKFYADYYANLLPEGKKSTKGCGKTAPRADKSQKLGDVIVPCGQSVSTGLTNSSLLYNEFIVYDIAQIKCRYLLRMKFNYS